MKATRHNGRSGKHGTYDAKHNDRRFDVENSEHIDAERTKMNVYGNDNPGAKSQGMKQFMAGAGVMLIGALLVPKLTDLIPSSLS